MVTSWSIGRAQDQAPEQPAGPTETQRDRTRAILAWKESSWEPTTGKLGAAITQLERAVANSPDQRDPTLDFLLGLSLLKSGRGDAARPLLDRAHRAAPNFSGFLLVDGVTLQLEERHGAAAEAFRRFLADADGLERVGAIATELTFLARVHHGQSLIDSGSGDEGIALLAEALAQSERDHGSPSVTCKVLLANAYSKQKEFGIAEALLAEVLRDDPWNPLHHYHRGIVAADQEDTDGAIRWFSAAVERSPGFAEPYAKLAYLAHSDRRLDDAYRYLETYASLTGIGLDGAAGSTASPNTKADVHAGFGAYWMSVANARLDDGDPEGRVRALRNAATAFRAALEFRRDCVKSLDALIQILYQLGEGEDERNEYADRIQELQEELDAAPTRSTFC